MISNLLPGRVQAPRAPGRSGTVAAIRGPGQSILTHQIGDPLPTTADLAISVAFTADGTILAATAGQAEFELQDVVVLWDLTDRRAPHQIGDPLPVTAGSVGDVAFAADGATLAVGAVQQHVPYGSTGTVTLWDLTDRRTPREIGGPVRATSGDLYSVAFSPDGATVAAGINATPPVGGDSGDIAGSVALWKLTDLVKTRADPLAPACRRAGRGLTAAEWERYIPGVPYTDTCRGPAG